MCLIVCCVGRAAAGCPRGDGPIQPLTSLSPQRDALIERRTYQWCSVPSALQLTDKNQGLVLTEGAPELQHNGKLIDDHGSASADQGDSCLGCLFLIRLKHFDVVSKVQTCAAQNHALNQYYCLVDQKKTSLE